MSEHTPEPWTSGTDPSHFDAPEVRNSAWALYVPTDADARRIVACVNACAGLSTEALESGALGEALEAFKEISESYGCCTDYECENCKAVTARAYAARRKLEGK
jgi:hypothetical protein